MDVSALRPRLINKRILQVVLAALADAFFLLTIVNCSVFRRECGAPTS